MDEIEPEDRRGIVRSIGWPVLFGFCLAGCALVLFWWFASEVFEGETASFDNGVRDLAQAIASPFLTRLMIFISFVGSPGSLTVLGVIVAIVFLRLKWKHAFLLFAVTMTGEIVLEQILKALFQRARPEPFFDLAAPSSYSFPSGHVLGSFCFFAILAWLISARIRNTAAIRGIRALAVILVPAVGLSRVYLGVHYPSDVIAAYLAAFVWTATVALGDAFFHRKQALRL
jgi:undecaprenyl-diphosphatase